MVYMYLSSKCEKEQGDNMVQNKFLILAGSDLYGFNFRRTWIIKNYLLRRWSKGCAKCNLFVCAFGWGEDVRVGGECVCVCVV